MPALLLYFSYLPGAPYCAHAGTRWYAFHRCWRHASMAAACAFAASSAVPCRAGNNARALRACAHIARPVTAACWRHGTARQHA